MYLQKIGKISKKIKILFLFKTSQFSCGSPHLYNIIKHRVPHTNVDIGLAETFSGTLLPNAHVKKPDRKSVNITNSKTVQPLQ
jgi:hypothetical protein